MLAREIAERHRLFIVEVMHKGEPAFVVYRKAAYPGARANRLCRRKSASKLLAFVRTFTGEAEHAPV